MNVTQKYRKKWRMQPIEDLEVEKQKLLDWITAERNQMVKASYRMRVRILEGILAVRQTD